MKREINFLLAIVIFLASILNIGCAANKHYRDGSGVLKTNSRSASGVNK